MIRTQTENPPPPPLRSDHSRRVLISASFFLSTSFAFCLPIQIYLANTVEHSVPLAVVLRACVLAAIAIFALGSGLALLIPPRIRPQAAAILAGVCLLAYLHANILVWNYGLLDGRQLEWARHTGKGWVELAGAVAILAATVRFRDTVNKFATVTLAMLSIIALGTTAVRIIGRPAAPSAQFYTIDESRVSEFSPTRNIILIVLDEFQTNTFSQIIQADDGLRNAFHGFVYFPDAVAGYAKTYGSIPNLMTGAFYDNQKPFREYLADAYLSSPLVGLRKAGYRVELYPWNNRIVHYDPGYISNLSPTFSTSLFPPEVVQLFDLSIFRHCPHFLRLWLTDGRSWPLGRLSVRFIRHPAAAGSARQVIGNPYIPRDLQFANAFTTATVSSDPSPCFKFYHFQGAHEPFWLGSDLVTKRLAGGPAGYREQCRATLEVVRRFLETLDRLNLTKHTDVIIASDHGAGEYSIAPPGQERASKGSVSAFVRSSGIPIVALRQAGQNHAPFTTSTAPVALVDIQATIADLAGVPRRNAGFSLLEEARPSRVRTYYHYAFKDSDQQYLPSLVEYEVNGNSWEPNSWRSTGVTLHPRGIASPAVSKVTAKVVPLQPGTPQFFGSGGNAVAYLKKGWSYPEKGFTWSLGKASSLLVPVDAPPGDYVLSIRARPWLLPKQHARQRIFGRLNDHVIDPMVLEETTAFRMLVPAEVIHSGRLSLNLDLPDAASPLLDYRASPDSRVLGISLSQIELLPLPGAPKDGALSFAADGNGLPYLLSGWNSAEAEGVWTNSHSAAIAIPQSVNNKSLSVEFSVRPFVSLPNLSAQEVTIFANGKAIASWNLTKASQTTLHLSETSFAGGWCVLRFDLPSAARPSDIKPNPGADGRLLGLCLRSISLNATD